MFRVVLTDQVFPSVDLERETLATIGASFEVASGDRESVLASISDADAVLTTYFPLDRQAIERLSHCKIIARYGIGVDNIDLVAAAERSIAVTNVPDYCIEEVALHTVAIMLFLARRLNTAQNVIAQNGWGIKEIEAIRRFSTLTLGIVGSGRIGRKVMSILGPLVHRVLVHDPYLNVAPEGTRLVSLDYLLTNADIVSLHCPLTDATRGLIGDSQLALMKPTATLINTSRGPLVQLGPLCAALESGKIAGAALDVLEVEPPPLAVPTIANLLVTPHMAYYSEEALAESQAKATNQVMKVLQGAQPDYAVVPRLAAS